MSLQHYYLDFYSSPTSFCQEVFKIQGLFKFCSTCPCSALLQIFTNSAPLYAHYAPFYKINYLAVRTSHLNKNGNFKIQQLFPFSNELLVTIVSSTAKQLIAENLFPHLEFLFLSGRGKVFYGCTSAPQILQLHTHIIGCHPAKVQVKHFVPQCHAWTPSRGTVPY